MKEECLSDQQSILDLNDLAPISVSVYTRLWHFQQCIESLANNKLAQYSKLYVFSDAPKPGDEEKVLAVREYAKKIKGFKEVILKFQQENDRKRNVTDAREIPLNEHGKMIRMEDDNIVGPHALQFINEGLVLYKDDPIIISITGYSPPIGQNKYVHGDAYLSYFFSAWVFGVWKEKKYLQFLSLEKPYADMISSGLLSRVKSIHPKLPDALKRMDEGTHRAGDQKLSYFMIKHGMYQIKPVQSMVRNIGNDGSGVHCGVSKKFDIDACQTSLNVRLKQIKYVPKIDRLQYRYFHGSRLRSSVVLFVKEILSDNVYKKLLAFKGNAKIF